LHGRSYHSLVFSFKGLCFQSPGLYSRAPLRDSCSSDSVVVRRYGISEDATRCVWVFSTKQSNAPR